MPNERDLTRRCRDWLEAERKRGAPLWYLKTQSEGMQRAGVPDLLLCCNGLFAAVELKNPKDVSFLPAPRQKIELNWLRQSGAKCLVTNDFDAFVAFVREILEKKS